MSAKLHDDEFSPEILLMLKQRDILGRLNPAQLVPLRYNSQTEAEAMVQKFQDARRDNPLLETTPAEAWLTAELMPVVEQIRAKVDIPEKVLDATLQRYFCRAMQPIVDRISDEQQLCTSVEVYLTAIKQLLIDLYDRRKSLRGILRISPTAYTVRKALAARMPTSRREAVFLQGITEGWKNHQIARALDERGLKPRNRDYKSYREMHQIKNQLFCALKSDVKRKYQMM